MKYGASHILLTYHVKIFRIGIHLSLHPFKLMLRVSFLNLTEPHGTSLVR